MSDTELLEKIVQNTEPKTSTQIVVSENSTKIKTNFNPPRELDRTRKYEMALVNLKTYYSFPNLSDENNVFQYSPGFVEVGRGDRDGGEDASRQRQWVDIRIPEGSYCYRQVLPEQRILIYKISSTEKSISLTKVIAMTRRVNQ